MQISDVVVSYQEEDSPQNTWAGNIKRGMGNHRTQGYC